MDFVLATCEQSTHNVLFTCGLACYNETQAYQMKKNYTKFLLYWVNKIRSVTENFLDSAQKCMVEMYGKHSWLGSEILARLWKISGTRDFPTPADSINHVFFTGGLACYNET